ncbi:MAG: hypothetical protein Q6J68_07010 [Thermostichales cyanobacterium SZTDM-1c_bins_54]
MSLLQQWLRRAEDELTEYSTPARKREKLRRAIGLAVSPADQARMCQELEGMLATGLSRYIEENRQTVALPFWGIGGLGLLEGFLGQPWGWLGAVVGISMAFGIQKWGWQMQAQRLLWETLQEIQQRSQARD